MRDHVRILAILNIIFGSLGLLVGIGLFFMFGGIGVVASVSGEPDAAIALPILGAVGGLIFMILVVMSAPQIIGGIGLLKKQSWARILMIVLSALGLLNIPIGTAMGIYGLWVLLSDETARLFSGSAPQPVRPVQRQA